MPTPQGQPFYCNLSGLLTLIGNTFVTQYSDVDGTGQLNSNRCNLCLLQADAKINQCFSAVGFYATNPYLSLGQTSTILTNLWAAYFGMQGIYDIRKMRDTKDKGHWSPLVAKYETDMQICASGKMRDAFDAAQRWPQSDGAPWTPGDPIPTGFMNY